MFHANLALQHAAYNRARSHLILHPDILIKLEQYLIDHLYSLIQTNINDLKRDYNEASYLYPFWKNYPPDA